MNSRAVYRALPYLACFLACAAVNLIYFPPATVFPDEQRYLDSALRLAATGQFWVGDDRAWEMPGTAAFFAPWVWLFGVKGAVLPVRTVQTVLLVIQCALVAVTVRRIFASTTAVLIATWMMALYPFFLFYQGLLLSETLFNALMLGGVAALYWWRERGLRFDCAFALACLCFALATWTKATLTILPPLLLAATAWLSGVTLRRALTILVAATCLYAALLSPWWIRNATLLNAFVPFTTSSAQNLYLGNNLRNVTAGIDWATDADPAVVARLSALPEIERQRAYGKLATDYIKENPGAFVHAAAKKFVRFWNVVPNAAEFQGIYALVSAASFGPVLALALICAIWRRRDWRTLAPIVLIAVYFTLLHVITIASLRYRVPLEPLLIMLAAGPLGALVERLRSRASHNA